MTPAHRVGCAAAAGELSLLTYMLSAICKVVNFPLDMISCVNKLTQEMASELFAPQVTKGPSP
jgi:hypothetical protein